VKHAYSAEDAHFQTAETAAHYLSLDCTRTQSLQIRKAVDLYWQTRNKKTHYPNSLYVASQLKGMRADVPTLISAILGDNNCSVDVPVEQINEQFGSAIAELTRQVRWLNELSMKDSALVSQIGSGDQAEMLRRMILAMVEDIRVVLVKLAFRTQRLYDLVKTDSSKREEVATETLSIYAPLANRLGLGQLKWELEDVAFRILDPHAYKRIAKSLEENRASRETYIVDFVKNLQSKLSDNNLNSVQVFGRPKHIYSIWKKMQTKRLDFTDLFDVRAVRVLVDDIPQCYGVLGVVHNAWQPITREFDDYIANPKPNGYRSLHTAIIGPLGKPVEVQIRTKEMDDDAENGVAAHWAYKEGGPTDEALQRSIDTLKQLLEDSDEQLVEGFSQQLQSERVYVFTPKGEVVDLVKDATPLDFAYHVHSEIGHRCRGAKVNGSIVNLTYALQNGDRVEVLTTREAAPSRDWLNKSLGYIKSSRARGKVRAWFNTQDHDQHLIDGRAILDRELKRLKATAVSIDKISRRLKFDKPADLFAAIGRSEVTVPQIAGAIDRLSEPQQKDLDVGSTPSKRVRNPDSVSVRGVGNLLTNIATCCQPVPNDEIVGFITRSKGVSIHRADCKNMLNLPESEQQRLIDVEWGANVTDKYPVDIRITAYDRVGLLRDVSTVMANNKAEVIAVNTLSNPVDQTAEMKIGVLVSNMYELTNIMEKIRQLRNVSAVERLL
jgi:GTP pyrophosphokinase